MAKIILFRLPENRQSISPEREPEPESGPKLSREELREQRKIRQFDMQNEAAIVNYFAHRLNEAEHQYQGPVNLKQFYIDQAIKTMPQLKFNKRLLTGMISAGIAH